MKKLLCLLVLLLVLTGCNNKKNIDLLDADYNDVKSIEVFDGSNGKKILVSDKEQIKDLITCFNSVILAYDGSAKGIDGFKYNVKINFENDSFKQFIINSDDRFIYNSNFYNVIEGESGYDKITYLYTVLENTTN